jgi:hypothetical protein
MKKNFENLLGNAISAKRTSENDIRDKIVVRDDFKDLIPRLSDEELSLLEESIKNEGVRDPLVIWDNGSDYILIDGHNRFFLSQKHGFDFPFKVLQFKDEEEVKYWMIINQLGRRNLTKEQSSYLRGLRYNREKSQGKRTDLTLDQNEPKFSHSTASVLAKEYNVSEATIKRDGDFSEGLEKLEMKQPGVKDKVLKGELKGIKNIIQEIGKGNLTEVNLEEPINKSIVTKSKKLTHLEIASIAILYIKIEKRTFERVSEELGIEGEKNPIGFLISWSETKQTKI